MAVFAGSAAGGVAGKVAWEGIGEIAGHVAGGVVGGIAWAAWLFIERRKASTFGAQVFRLGRRSRLGELRGNLRQITLDEARSVGGVSGLIAHRSGTVRPHRLEVKLEHRARDPETNVTNDDVLLTGRIASGRI